MIAELQYLYNKTQELAEHINDASSEDLDALTEQRNTVINGLQQQPVVSEEMKTIIRLIGEYDNTITDRMQALMDEAAQGLNKIKVHRLQKSKYEQAFNADSYFIDMRNK